MGVDSKFKGRKQDVSCPIFNDFPQMFPLKGSYRMILGYSRGCFRQNVGCFCGMLPIKRFVGCTRVFDVKSGCEEGREAGLYEIGQ
jgi:hypothetical protein